MKRPFDLSNLSFYLGLILLVNSCQDIIKIQVPNSKTILSVDAVLTNRGFGDTIRLTKTLNYFSDSLSSPFKGADITLSDSTGGSEHLLESKTGIFPIRKTIAKINHTYYLDIYTATDHFKARTHINRLSPTLDSVRYQYEDKSIQYDTAGYYLYFFGKELPGMGDHAWIRVYRNGKYFNRAEDLFVINDDFTDGKYYSGVNLRTKEAFQLGDIARVEIWSITKEAYTYLDQIQAQINNRGIFQTTPANVPTNILSTQGSSSTTATGYFIGALIEKISEPITN